jgi:hypothetical protein
MYNEKMPISPATLPDNQEPAASPVSGIDVVLDDGEAADAEKSSYDPLTGISITVSENGDVEVDFDARKKMAAKDTSFSANLAEKVNDYELSGLCDDILRGINNDIETRAQLEKTYDRGIDLLGLTLEEASSEATAEGTVSKTYDSTLLEAVINYQCTTSAELLPSTGPVKVKDYTRDITDDRLRLADDLENDMNYYLTSVRKEYYPDTRRMLFAQGFCGNGFKKIYRCPIRKAPVSDYVSMQDFIVSNDTVSLANCGRMTHKTALRPSVMKRMMLAGVYRDVDLVHPHEQPTTTERKIKKIEGIMPQPRYEDERHTVYESYVEVDLSEYGFYEPGAPDGLPLPYRITIDKDSREILEIRRNWREDDEDFTPIIRFVHYGFIPGLGFYHYGFIHILGNTARALTALGRQLLDAGQFANFPGLLSSDVGGRQETTQIRVNPGGMKTIKTGGMKITDVVMALPYKEPSQVLMTLAKNVSDNARRLAMTAQVQVGEGRADVPVGTMMALIEQATKPMAALHKQNHSSQQEEFEKLKELFAEDPTALSRYAKNPRRKWEEAEEFNDLDLVPVSDPNVPSHVHRVMMATALSQLVNIFEPELNKTWALEIILSTLGYPSQGAINPPAPPPQPPPPPPPDPSKMALVQVKAKQEQREAATAIMETQARENEQQMEDQSAQADRDSRERIEQMKLEEAKLKVGADLHNAEQDRVQQAQKPLEAPAE